MQLNFTYGYGDEKKREFLYHNFTIAAFIIVIIVIISIIIKKTFFTLTTIIIIISIVIFVIIINIIIISQYYGFTRARSILKVTFYPHYSNDKIKTIRERIRTVSVSLPMFLLLSPETENGSSRSERSAGQTMLNSS